MATSARFVIDGEGFYANVLEKV